MDEQTLAVAPPVVDEPVTTAPVAPPSAKSTVAPVKIAQQAADLGAVNIVSQLERGIKNGDGNAVADIITKKNEADSEGHINTHTQWGGVVASLLKGDYVGAWKNYNGGPTRWEEGVTGSGEKVYKLYNARGYTGEMADTNYKPLTQRQKLEYEERGVVTKADRTAIEGAAFQSERNIGLSAKTGLAQPVIDSMKKSYETSLVASQTNNKISQSIDRLKKSPILDIVSKLTPEQRKDVFGSVQTMANQQAGTTTAAGETKGASGTVTKGGTANIGGEGGVGKKGAGNVGGSAGIGASATTQGTASQGTSAEAGTSATSGKQDVENMITKIQKYTQGAIKTPEELDAVRAYLQDTLVINQVNANLNAKDRAPGVVAVPPLEMGLTSRKESISNAYDMQRNNALDAAWAAFQSHKVRSGQVGDMEANREEFMNSNTFRGINNKYDALKKANQTGQDHKPEDGFIDVGPNNRPRVWKDGKPEYLNVR